MAFTTIQVEPRGRVGLVTLDRPKALNAINAAMLTELGKAMAYFDADPAIGCIVLTGSERAFAAGADIREMAPLSATDAFLADLCAGIDRIAAARKPVVAAVAGYALGGGCELALTADIVLAADNAKFGLPEITLGIIPGMGGTQRLARLVGKARAMELILSGRQIDAAEAERLGMVARVVPAAAVLDEALATAERIAGLSLPAVMMAKEAVLRAFELPLTEGVRHERRLFQSLFGSDGQKEGMAAFLEKRPAVFRK